MIPVVEEPVEHPVRLRAEPERCALCRRPTRTWHATIDVPVCDGCAATRDPDDLPTKTEWWDSHDAGGTPARREGTIPTQA